MWQAGNSVFWSWRFLIGICKLGARTLISIDIFTNKNQIVGDKLPSKVDNSPNPQSP